MSWSQWWSQTQERTSLVSLPDGVDDVAAFLEEYAQNEEELRQNDSDIARLRIEKAEVRLPTDFVRGDGQVLGARLLSTGTLDVLGLAIRLAVAGYYLNEPQGFLVMNDPLVDMDGTRQQLAASLLREYADENDRQLIAFTCHPSRAEVLGGRRVGLG